MMQIFDDIQEWRRFRNALSTDAGLGFAPTMGNLHAGHGSLFMRSKQENRYTASSLFVNPTQFNQAEDFNHYPRTLDADLQLMEESGVDFCVLPDEKAIYADGYSYQIQENQLCQLMEGKHRPGHFNGVLTVVMKLFQVIKPTNAYFGEKDFQQYLLIKNMADAFFMDINVQACPTIREKSGLAYSSRNNRLSPDQKQLAEQFAQIFHQNKPCTQIISELSHKNIGIEYVEEHFGRCFAAVIIGGVRLIDNYSRN